MRFLLSAAIGGLAVMLLPRIIPGIKVENYKSGLKLVVAMAIINLLMKILFGWLLLPFQILTLGLGYLIVNAIVLDVASDIVGGITIDSFKSAFMGSLVLSITWTILGWIILP